RRAHSRTIFASLATLSHFAPSFLIRSANSAGELATGSKPSVRSRSLTSGSATMRTISRCQRSTISGGVPASVTIPVTVSDSWSGTPASAMVGTSGSSGLRLAASTASPRSLPSLTLAIAPGSAVKDRKSTRLTSPLSLHAALPIPHDLAMPAFHDIRRCPRKRSDPGHRIGLLVRHARLRHGGDVWQLGIAFGSQHREPAQLAVLDVGDRPRQRRE